LREVLKTGLNYCLASAALAEGTNDHTIQIVTNPVPYVINGVWYSKAATNNITPTTCAVQAVGTRCRYLIALDASGNVIVTKGTEVQALSYGAVTTLSFNPTEKKLVDSAGGLTGGWRVNDKVLVSGFTSLENNGLFTVEAVDDNGGWIKFAENGMVEEAEGDSVTITRESPLPDLPYGQAPLGYLRVTTGTTSFTVGTQDITNDIGTGSTAFVNLSRMPAQ
jgi:hypothetical protein